MSGNTELPQKITDILTQEAPLPKDRVNNVYICRPRGDINPVEIKVQKAQVLLFENSSIQIGTIAAIYCPENRGGVPPICDILSRPCPNAKK